MHVLRQESLERNRVLARKVMECFTSLHISSTRPGYLRPTHRSSQAQVYAAARSGDESRLLDLLAGAPEGGEAASPVDALNEEGFTPLHASAAFGHVGCAKLLLERGADVNVHGIVRPPACTSLACGCKAAEAHTSPLLAKPVALPLLGRRRARRRRTAARRSTTPRASAGRRSSACSRGWRA